MSRPIIVCRRDVDTAGEEVWVASLDTHPGIVTYGYTPGEALTEMHKLLEHLESRTSVFAGWDAL